VFSISAQSRRGSLEKEELLTLRTVKGGLARSYTHQEYE
jgi:hypothetical protein